MIKNMVRSMVLGADDALSRIFITLDPSLNSYYEIANPITLAGDFEVEVEFSVGNVSANNNLVDFGEFLLRVESDTEIRVWGDVGFSLASFTVPSLGASLHTLKIIGNVTSTSITIDLDGTTYGPVVAGATPNFTGDWFIGRWVAAYFDGVIANVKITDTDASTVTTFALDEATQNYELSEENVFGSELWDGVLSDTGTGWTDNGDGSYTCDGTQVGSTSLRINNKVVQDDTYQTVMEVVSITAGAVVTKAGNDASIGRTATGIYTDIQAPTTSDPHIRVQGDIDFIGTVRLVSFKEVTNAVIYNNIPESNREVFTLVGDDWIGQELWTYGNGVSTGSEGTFTQLAGVASGGVAEDTIYEYSVTVSGLTSGQLRFRLGDNLTLVSTSVDGTFTGVIDSGSNTRLEVVVGNAQSNSGATISVTTTKRILEAP